MRQRAAWWGLLGRAIAFAVALLWLAGSIVIAQRHNDDLNEIRELATRSREEVAVAREHVAGIEVRVKAIEDMNLATRLARIETYVLGILVPVGLMGLETLMRIIGRVLAFRLMKS